MAPAPFLALGVLAVVVLMASGGGAFLWYRRKARLRQRQESWRELCLRLELAPQPGEARVARGELRETAFVLHDTGSEWLVEVPLAQPLLPPGLLLLSPDASGLPPRTRLRSLEWASASTPPELQAWCVEGAELSGKVEAPYAFLDEAARAMRAHAPLRVESRRLIQALRVGAQLSVKEAREAVLALEATARGWLVVAEHSGLPWVKAPSAPAVHPAPRSVSTPRVFSLRRAASRFLGGVLLTSWAWAMAGRGAFSRLLHPKSLPKPRSLSARLVGVAHRFRDGAPWALWTCAVAGVGAFSLYILYRMATDRFGELRSASDHEAGIVAFASVMFFFLAAGVILLFQGKWRAHGERRGPRAQALPRRLQPVSLFLFTLMGSLVLGPGIWLVRERLNDEAAFEAALLEKTGELLERYASYGGRRAAEAAPLISPRRFQYCEQIDTEDCWRGLLKQGRGPAEREALIQERLHRAALAVTLRTEARLKQFLERYPTSAVAAEVREQLLPVAALQEVPINNVSGLRRFRERYPRSVVDAQAQARIHELFAAAQAGFLSQASPRNPQAVEFMSQLLTYLESSESSRVRVGFRRQLASSLSRQSADSLRWQAQWLEDRSVKQLDDAFLRPFYGAMKLERSELQPTEDTGVTHPRIDIDYTMGASGWSYTLGRDGRQLAALQFDFEVTLRRPGARPVRFRLQVRPPRDFPFDGLGPDSMESAVYNALAKRAFDELRGKFGEVFFRADSEAFQALHQRTP